MCRETGYHFLRNYTFKEYDHQPQNWSLGQAENGLIYVGNDGGVLEYDGVSWRVIKVPGYHHTRSLAIAPNGNIYIGGKNKIGYIEPDNDGNWQYRSLLSHLDEKYKRFSNVWATHAVKKSIYFRTHHYLMRWNSGQLRIREAKAKEQFLSSFVYNDTLFIQQLNKGLMQINNGLLQPVPGGETFSNTRIVMFAPMNRESAPPILIGTRSKGFFMLDGNRLFPFPTKDAELKSFLQKNVFIQGIRLSSGDFALATRKGGLAIMDSRGNLKRIYAKEAGLQDIKIQYIMEDRQGNIWSALSNGISKIEYGSPFIHYDKRSGLPGLILSFTRHGGSIYAGTSNGLYVQHDSCEKFRPVPEIDVQCLQLLSVEDSIFAATSEGTFQIKNKQIQKIADGPSYALLYSAHQPNTIWCGTQKGLIAFALEKNQWTLKHEFKSITNEIRAIAEDQKGNVFLSLSPRGILKINFSQGIAQPDIIDYSTVKGLPPERAYAALIAGHIMFATEKGIFQYNEAENKFIPDGTLGELFMGDLKSGTPVFRIVEDINKVVWIHSQSRNYQAVPREGQTFEIRSTPFLRLPLVQVQGIFPSTDGETIWFAGFDGLTRYDAIPKRDYSQPFSTLVRRVNINENKKLIFNGCSKTPVRNDKETFPTLNYNDRNIYFHFAASFFEAETETHYRYFLEGYDKGWSPWEKETKRYYTNLDSGIYRFRVQARNIYLHEGNETQFVFKILPPWYQTGWAFSLYSLCGVLAVYWIVRWRSRTLIREKEILETIVNERTREIKEQRDRLEAQATQLQVQSENLKELDKVKSRFFANISHEFRTPLTLIMSPLEQMIETAGHNKKEKKQFHVMLRNSQRLLTLINQLLELARFDSGKAGLHAACQNIVPFVKEILDSFQELAQRNQISLEFQSSPALIDLYFDAPKMEEVMYNLLINAIKFTPPGGKITVSISIAPFDAPDALPPHGFAKISVMDSGVGISAEHLPYIFDRFFQSRDLIKETERKGTGIGLSLTKELVMLHHGKIDVHSSPKKGTEFVVLLPLGHQHLNPAEIVLHTGTTGDQQYPKQERNKNKEIKLLFQQTGDETEDFINMGSISSKEPPEQYSQSEPKQKTKTVILLVEDEADIRQYIREPLEPTYEVIEACNGKEGIEKAKEVIPDLIISDIMMPEADGFELCRILKKDFNTSHIPIILLTAKASMESELRGLEKGADDYVTKPFNTQMLLARVRNLIELRRQLQLKIQRKKMLLPEEIVVSSQDDLFLKDVQQIIEENISDPDFDIKVLQEKLLIGRTTLFRKIEALTGETPNEFLYSYRLERGAKLLRENFGNVTEVAMAVGFDTPQYFATRFRKKYHQSPSSYQASESKTK